MIAKLIITGGAAIILALLVARKYQILFWLMLFSMVIGPRRAHFVYQDIINEIDWEFNVIPFTLLLGLLSLLTIKFARFTLDKWDISTLVLLGFSFIVGMANGVPLDDAVLWTIPISSVFLTKHVTIVFVRTPATYQTALRIFHTICLIIAVGSILTALGITLGGFLLPAQAYGVVSEGKLQSVMRAEGFWGTATVAGVTVTSILLLPYARMPIYIKLTLASVQLASVMVSGKRLAFLSLALSSLFLILGSKGRHKRASAFAIAAVIGISAWVYLPSTGVLERFGEVSEALSGEGETDSRIVRVNYAINAFIANPIFGGGSGYVGYIHNGYFELIANMGLAAVPVIAALLIPLVKGYRSGGVSRVWAQIAIIYMFSPFMLEAVLNRPEHLTFLGFFLGMIQVTNYLESRGAARSVSVEQRSQDGPEEKEVVRAT